jgi:hypothetical protein
MLSKAPLSSSLCTGHYLALTDKIPKYWSLLGDDEKNASESFSVIYRLCKPEFSLLKCVRAKNLEIDLDLLIRKFTFIRKFPIYDHSASTRFLVFPARGDVNRNPKKLSL